MRIGIIIDRITTIIILMKIDVITDLVIRTTIHIKTDSITDQMTETIIFRTTDHKKCQTIDVIVMRTDNKTDLMTSFTITQIDKETYGTTDFISICNEICLTTKITIKEDNRHTYQIRNSITKI